MISEIAKTILRFNLSNVRANLKTHNELARVLLPYCIYPADGAGRILLNREYKPIGVPKAAPFIHYDDPKYAMWLITTDEGPHDRFYHFFNDGNPPWSGAADFRDYVSRVSSVLGL
jgi:hypothetical protein